MLHTRAVIEQRGGGSDFLLPSSVRDMSVARSVSQEARDAAERALDQVLADSFPASDAPSWSPGIARPAGSSRGGSAASTEERTMTFRVGASATIPSANIARPRTGGTFGEGLTWLGAITGMALLAPVAILLLGLPVALAVRGIAEAIGWLVARLG